MERVFGITLILHEQINSLKKLDYTNLNNRKNNYEHTNERNLVIDKIKEALDDAIKAKKQYRHVVGADWHFWDGYEQALTYALFHIIGVAVQQRWSVQCLIVSFHFKLVLIHHVMCTYLLCFRRPVWALSRLFSTQR